MAELELVVAVAENDVIGMKGALPWHLPADLGHFKALTLGKSLLMGRRTYASIGRALPGRHSIVLTRDPSFNPGDCEVVGTLAAACRAVNEESTLMVIGGAEVYRQCLPLVRRMHLTLVHTMIANGDTFFADWREPEWIEAARERHAADAKNALAYSFLTLERRSP